MFIAVLFTVYRAWKQSSCPSVNEWIKKKNWYIHTMQYYSVVKRNRPSSHEKTQKMLNAF